MVNRINEAKRAAGPATIKAMTPESLADFAKSVIPTANRLQLTMMPD